ncbi:hypothetical protein A3A40_03485 [Candidatus Kaiserbacteria bacterium RIFCSPLOWO2_01_FULL_54_20]|uniref:DUF5678 domain-containing protein n=1 Tax=Candidatus Kaiserbacteria bacterium RIFCSPLOWO2_01_FULL_54_20 TaxID=1798513 RepID=A0A1F6EKS7_9BACT|nr:MAG: hypothetical protein A3A40_03485 [Candidatus Kaiserbacteria bacterium RIFCSPLOWO2_01_FULL_54_20]
MKLNTDLKKKVLGQEYVGKWVALSEDQSSVIDSSEDLAVLSKRIGDNKNVIYTRVLDSNQVYAF